jgi:Tfp pilus assembly protein PilX
MLSNQRGTVFPVTLMIILLLTTLALSVTALGMSEPQIASNVAGSARARAVAEAGLEWGYIQVVNAADFTAALTGADGYGVRTLATNQAVPGMAATAGTFTVTLRNDNLAGDNLITGVPIEGSATVDANNRLIMTATGTYGNATRRVQVLVRRTALPPIAGALMFPGNDANTSFNGTAFEVNGNDYNVAALGQTPTAGTCAAVYGIATANSSNETVVQNSLSSSQKPKVLGKKQNTSQSSGGDNAIAPDAALTQSLISSFVKDAKNQADVSLWSPSPSGLTYDNVGTSACTSNWASQSCWGTADKPKIVYIEGQPDPTSAFSAITLNGNVEGHGILVVKNGDMRVNGNFLWHGLVIVTGDWVGLGFMGSVNGTDQAVYGAVISNETSTDPLYEGVVYADAKLRYSCQGLAQARSSRRLVTMSSWKEISQ